MIYATAAAAATCLLPLSLADLFALKFHLALLIIGIKTAYKVYRAQLLAALATGYQCVESVTYFRFL